MNKAELTFEIIKDVARRYGEASPEFVSGLYTNRIENTGVLFVDSDAIGNTWEEKAGRALGLAIYNKLKTKYVSQWTIPVNTVGADMGDPGIYHCKVAFAWVEQAD